MDIFQLIGDMLHLLAMILLLRKIFSNRNVVGTFRSRFRLVVQNSRDLCCGFSHQIRGLIYGVENLLPLLHENLLHRSRHLHCVFDRYEQTLLPKLWQRVRFIPSLLSLHSRSYPGSHYPQILLPHAHDLELQYLAWSPRDFTSALHDCQKQRCVKFHCPLHLVLGTVSNFLYLPLVREE